MAWTYLFSILDIVSLEQQYYMYMYKLCLTNQMNATGCKKFFSAVRGSTYFVTMYLDFLVCMCLDSFIGDNGGTGPIQELCWLESRGKFNMDRTFNNPINDHIVHIL